MKLDAEVRAKLDELMKGGESIVDLLGGPLRSTKDEPHEQQPVEYQQAVAFVWRFYLTRLQLGSGILGAVVAVIGKILTDHQ